MQTFLERLGKVIEPSRLLEPNHIRELAKSIQDEYLAVALYGRQDAADAAQVAAGDPDRNRELRDAALYLEMVLLSADSVREQHIQDALEVAATVFEFLSRSTPNVAYERWIAADGFLHCLFNGPLNDLLRAGLLYALAGKPANGHLLLENLGEISAKLATSSPKSERPVIRSAGSAIRCIGRLMAGRREDLDAALRHGFEVEQQWIKADGIDAVMVFWSIARVATVVLRAAFGAEIGGACKDLIPRMHASAAKLHDPGFQWLTYIVGRVMTELLSASVGVALQGYGFPESYLASLVATGTPRLWPSQLHALDKGLLNETGHFVVGLPTGAGKSLLAELLIVKALHGLGDGWCAYLAPSRALVRQVERDLRLRLPKLGISVHNVIAGAEQGDSLKGEIDVLAGRSSVTILTPEKMDTYLRFAPEVLSSCAVCIVDEAHLIGSDERGLRLETLLAILRVKNPALRIVCFSAVMSNPEELAAWLGSPRAFVRGDWRPTRQLKGVLVREKSSTVAEEFREVQPRPRAHWVPMRQGETKRKGMRVRIGKRDTFNLGLALVRDESDLDMAHLRHLSLPSLITSTLTEYQVWSSAARRPKSEIEADSSTDLAIALALRLLRISRRQLLFFTVPDSAEKAARSLADGFRALPGFRLTQARRRLADMVSAVLGREDPLVRCVQAGVAYHHSGLPTIVKRLVEVAAKNQTIDILCATSTLAEGLNVPAQIVLIVGGRHFSEDEEAKRVDMPVASFENIAGRAGRAFVSTEGLVVFIPEDYHTVASAVSQSRQYMFVGSDALRVRSALLSVLRDFDRWDDQASSTMITELSADSQVVLLALNAAGIVEDEELSRFVAATYAGYKLPSKTVKRVASKVRTAIDASRNAFGIDRLKLFSQTGLSISSCVAIYGALDEAVQENQPLSLQTAGDIDNETLEVLIRAVSQAPELWTKMRWHTLPTSLHARLVYGWLRQLEPQSEIVDAELSLYMKKTPKVRDLLRYYASVDNVLAWGFGVAYLFLDDILDGEADSAIGTLPLLAKYGVETLEAGLASLLGISDRVTAKVFGQAYRASERREASLARIQGWLSQLAVEDVESILTDELRQDLAIDDLRLERGTGVPRGVRVTMICRSQPKTPYVIVREVDDQLVGCDLEGNILGRFKRDRQLEEMVQADDCYGLVLGPVPGGVRVQVLRTSSIARKRQT